MKKILAIIALLVSVLSVSMAKDFNSEQKKLRLEIVKYLSEEGFNPEIDMDGDVKFERNGKIFYVVISSTHNDPFLISFYLEYSYNENLEEGPFTRKNIEYSLPIILKNKAVKLYCMDNSYCYRVDMYCKNSSLFKSSFLRVFNEIIDSSYDLANFLRNIPADLDMADNDAVFKKAVEYYLVDDHAKSFPLFKILSDRYYSQAYGYMGLAYELGEGVSEDEELMVKYYQNAIHNGQSWCAYRLGSYYYSKVEYTKALDCFELCGANENPYRSEALYSIGKMFEEGTGVDKNIDKAKMFYKKSVQYSTTLDCDARKALLNFGVKAEETKDFVDATKSMLMGLSAEEMYNTGLEYESGLNDRYVSLTKAYAYIKAAADRDYALAYAKMGDIYRNKYYPFNDTNKSDKFYRKAFKEFKEKENDGDACYELGHMYKLGLGVDPDKEQSTYYYKLAALQGNAYAAYEYGLICKSEMEYPEAAKFFKLAVQENVYEAMFELAELYEKGFGVTLSKENAEDLYKKCFLSNDFKLRDKAKKAIENLNASARKY